MRRMGIGKGKALYSLAYLLIFLLLANGCASIISGSKQELTFNSEPAGAKVTISGRVIGLTPMTTSIDRKSEQILVFEKEGYKPVTMQLTTTINGWFWGNIIIGGLLGSTTDRISGAYAEYSPNQYYIPLAPIEEIKKTNLEINNKIFVMMNYHQLVQELASEPGEYTKALFILMGIEKNKENIIINKMKDIAKTTSNPLVYAEKVTSISKY